jgi:hypothetical protein
MIKLERCAMKVEKQVDARVAKLLDDIHLTHAPMYELAQAIRKAVLGLNPQVSESVKYGGIMFAAPIAFCGVFVYGEHVSIEFGKGCDLDDAAGRLEGTGKFRRHIKVRASAGLKGIEPYLAQACANANAGV